MNKEYRSADKESSWFGFCNRKASSQDDDAVAITGTPSIQTHQNDVEQTNLRGQLTDQKDTIKGLNEMVKSMQTKLHTKDSQITELTKKLAQEMSTKVSSNESAIENVSIKNRPMNIADEYIALCTNEWLDAKNTLDKICPSWSEHDKLLLLCNVLTEAEIVCNERLAEKIHQLVSILLEEQDTSTSQWTYTVTTNQAGNNQTPNQPLSQETKPSSRQTLPQELTNVIGDYFRNQSDTIDLTSLTKVIVDKLDQQHPSSDGMESLFPNTSLHQYVSVTTRVVWKMVIQRPKMEFKLSNKRYDPKYHDPYWSSDVIPGADVSDVHPCLFQAQNLMTKGKVLLLDPTKCIPRN